MASNNIEKIKENGVTHDVGLRNIYINSKGNFNIETSPEMGNTTKGKINIESMSDIQIKPADDIILYSHHRDAGKNDEVAMKVTNGDDIPVKLQINAANLTISTKDKDLTKVKTNDANPTTVVSDKKEDEILDVNINTGKSVGNKKGYLKVRARAIDLRCEEHGGIALQPYGHDSDGNMNKIKFEHGGGDGLEFATFNTEKTSIYTDEYRFNKHGIVKMAEREQEVSDKYQVGKDETTHYKYVKQEDDFYDKIDALDAEADWESIIKTGNAFNYGKNRHAKMTNGGNLEIGTEKTYVFYDVTGTVDADGSIPDGVIIDPTKVYKADDLYFIPETLNGFETTLHYACGNNVYDLIEVPAPKLYLKSDNNIEITSNDKIKFTGKLDFGDTFSFGETEGSIQTIHKFTKKGATKACDTLQVKAINNGASDVTWKNPNTPVIYNDTVSIPSGTEQVVAQCSLIDLIKLVNYAKEQGWI